MQRIEALFEDGVLRPLDPVDLDENQLVTLLVLTTPDRKVEAQPAATLPVLRRRDGEDTRLCDEDTRLMLGIGNRPPRP